MLTIVYNIYDIYYWFKGQIGIVYFQFAFPHHISTNSEHREVKESLSGELFYELHDNVLSWLEENDIKSNSWTCNMEFNSHKMTYVIGFKNKIDAVAFKLRWA